MFIQTLRGLDLPKEPPTLKKNEYSHIFPIMGPILLALFKKIPTGFPTAPGLRHRS